MNIFKFRINPHWKVSPCSSNEPFIDSMCSDRRDVVCIIPLYRKMKDNRSISYISCKQNTRFLHQVYFLSLKQNHQKELPVTMGATTWCEIQVDLRMVSFKDHVWPCKVCQEKVHYKSRSKYL